MKHIVYPLRSMALQEILSLLEGIALHNDDWAKVADFVNLQVHRGDPVRSHDDCIAAFLRYEAMEGREEVAS